MALAAGVGAVFGAERAAACPLDCVPGVVPAGAHRPAGQAVEGRADQGQAACGRPGSAGSPAIMSRWPMPASTASVAAKPATSSACPCVETTG